MINELIPPDQLAPLLQKRLLQLNEALTQLKKTQKKPPAGHLRIAQKGTNRNYFYHYTSPDDLNGKYIPKKQIELAKTLAQKDYNLKLIKQIEKEIFGEDGENNGVVGINGVMLVKKDDEQIIDEIEEENLNYHRILTDELLLSKIEKLE